MRLRSSMVTAYSSQIFCQERQALLMEARACCCSCCALPAVLKSGTRRRNSAARPRVPRRQSLVGTDAIQLKEWVIEQPNVRCTAAATWSISSQVCSRTCRDLKVMNLHQRNLQPYDLRMGLRRGGVARASRTEGSTEAIRNGVFRKDEWLTWAALSRASCTEGQNTDMAHWTCKTGV